MFFGNRRYIDDTFLLFSHSDHVVKFLDYLNTKHNNINFTMEPEQQGSLPFLDVRVSRDDNKFVTSVFRKPTFSGLGSLPSLVFNKIFH